MHGPVRPCTDVGHAGSMERQRTRRATILRAHGVRGPGARAGPAGRSRAQRRRGATWSCRAHRAGRHRLHAPPRRALGTDVPRRLASWAAVAAPTSQPWVCPTRPSATRSPAPSAQLPDERFSAGRRRAPHMTSASLVPGLAARLDAARHRPLCPRPRGARPAGPPRRRGGARAPRAAGRRRRRAARPGGRPSRRPGQPRASSRRSGRWAARCQSALSSATSPTCCIGAIPARHG